VQRLRSSEQFKRIILQIYDRMMNVAKLARDSTQLSSERPRTLSTVQATVRSDA